MLFLLRIAQGTSSDPKQHPSLRRRQQENNYTGTGNSKNNKEDIDDPFTIIFVSDVENKYRGHDIARSKYIINYIRDLKEEQIPFDGEYSDNIVNPKLVIHGGDMSHMWSCDNFEWFVLGGCRDYEDEYKDIWNRLYNANIPMISSFGNHDWRALVGTGNPWGDRPTEPRNEEADYINFWSNKFTQVSYQKSNKLGVGDFQYEEIPPTGKFGQSMYRATFAGVQIVNFNAAFHWQSYDDGGVYTSEDQLKRLNATLDRKMKTLFFSHYPLNSYGLEVPEKPTLDEVKAMIREFGENTHHFSGHIHVQGIREYNDAFPNFNDYVAPYPHIWRGNEPGFFAILVSPKLGILQVKTINIPGLEPGERCVPFGYLNPRDYFFGFKPEMDGLPRKVPDDADKRNVSTPRLDQQNESINKDGLFLNRDLGCHACKSGGQTWSAERKCFVCQDGLP